MIQLTEYSEGNVLKDEPRPTKRTETETAALPVMKLWVKDKEAGKVIGRGGETVREVMEKSSAVPRKYETRQILRYMRVLEAFRSLRVM